MFDNIIQSLPYKSTFLFVDHITALDENGITGEHTLKTGAFFYDDHFENNPVTPGVILTEIMAQIGVVSLGIYLIKTGNTKEAVMIDECSFPLLASTEVSFFKMVMPGEKVIVTSKKLYFRFGKLKCAIEMRNEASELIAKGTFSGMIKNFQLEERANG